MSDIEVDLRVKPGSLNHALGGRTIGTDGCRTGVGMLAQMPDGSAWCAHFECSLAGEDRDELLMIERDAYSILRNALIVPPLALYACSTAPLTRGNGAIWAGMRAFFAGATIDQQAEGVYRTAAGAILYLGHGAQLSGQQATPNVEACIPIPVQR